MDLKSQLEAYQPFNEQEEKDRIEILRRLTSEEIYTRDNHGAHLTASAWVVSKDYAHVLMCYHKIYHSWSWLGGHTDGDRDLLHTAIREVQEESGLQNVIPLSQDIFSLEILCVDGHEKRGEYVSSHLHLNVTYLLQADMHKPLRIKPDENAGVKWFGLQEAIDASSEPWFKQRIYSKLNQKLAIYLASHHS